MLEENSQEEENPKEEIDKTPLMWVCEHHNLDKVRTLLSRYIDNTSQTTLGETAAKIPYIIDKEIKGNSKISFVIKIL